MYSTIGHLLGTPADDGATHPCTKLSQFWLKGKYWAPKSEKVPSGNILGTQNLMLPL